MRVFTHPVYLSAHTPGYIQHQNELFRLPLHDAKRRLCVMRSRKDWAISCRTKCSICVIKQMNWRTQEQWYSAE